VFNVPVIIDEKPQLKYQVLYIRILISYLKFHWYNSSYVLQAMAVLSKHDYFTI